MDAKEKRAYRRMEVKVEETEAAYHRLIDDFVKAHYDAVQLRTALRTALEALDEAREIINAAITKEGM